MTGRPHRRDPLTSEERKEFEEDLVLFCDRELDRLGDLRGLEVLYAGGASLLWIEGLSQRVGERGSVTALDADEERIETTKRNLEDADLRAPVRLVVGDVSRPPFVAGSFDLVYSAGLFHELDVRERGAGEALSALSALTAVARPGGRVATGDFVDTAPAAQLEDERLDAEFALASSGKKFFGIGAPERLVALHEGTLWDVRWMVLPPFPIRHLGKLVLGEDEPAGLSGLPPSVEARWRERRAALHDRGRREGYTRPATLYVEGRVRGV